MSESPVSGVIINPILSMNSILKRQVGRADFKIAEPTCATAPSISS
jgi:hypothetical protein